MTNAATPDAAVPEGPKAPEGIDAGPVTAWFEAHAPAVTPPLAFRLIAGGRSNLTYRVDDQAGHSWVLRRPPLGQVLATAHDMGREHTIISALAPTDVPVAPAVGLSADDSVNGAPFYVMDFVEGLIVRDRTVSDQLSPEARATVGREIPDVLARIHAVDPDEVGLGELGRKEGYIERQLRRWHRQFEQSKTREVPAVDAVHNKLSSRIPEQGRAAIVHGDYRLDNCLVTPEGRIAAVLDWELCTLGDPLADVGLLLVYWTDPDDALSALPGAATTAPGFPTKAEMVERYAAASGRDVSGVDYYVAFGYWKLACILEGVYARYRGGAMGSSEDSSAYDGFAAQVEFLAQAAHDAVERIG
jgi:aminoglycoside phosphotransferase (APT) family kinase protein